jgi:hypothetical protein
VCTNDIVWSRREPSGGTVIVTYGEAEGILAQLHEVAEATQRAAFRARLKNLKKLGIPLGSTPGRGKKITYVRDDLYQWAFCLECAQFGFDPTAVVETVKKSWDYIKECFKQAEEIKDDHVLMMIDPAFMSKALDHRGRYFFEGSEIAFPEHVGSRLKSGSYKRACIFDLTRVVREIDRLEQKINKEEGT